MRVIQRDERRLTIRHRRNMKQFARTVAATAAVIALLMWWDDLEWWLGGFLLIPVAIYAIFAWLDTEEYVFDRKFGRATLKLDSVIGSRKVSVPLASIWTEVGTDDDGDYLIYLTRDKKYSIPLRQKLTSRKQADVCAQAIEDFVAARGGAP